MKRNSSPNIKANWRFIVKYAAAVLCILCVAEVQADDSPPPPDAALPAPVQPLPDIEARTYSVSVVKRSRSGHVYLLQLAEDESPKEGKIVLLKKDDLPAMALRVLKLYPDRKQFAARRVRGYEPIRFLSPKDSFTAVEKIADVTAPPLSQQDQNEIHELEKPPPASAALAPPPSPPSSPPPPNSSQTAENTLSKPPALPETAPPPVATVPPAAAAEVAPPPPPPAEATPPPPEAAAEPSPEPTPEPSPETEAVPAPEPSPEATAASEPAPAPSAAPFDAELDAGTQPKNSESDDNLSDTESEDLDEISKIQVDEVEPIERDRFWLSAGVNEYANFSYNPAGVNRNYAQTGYFTGFNMRFGMNIGHEIFMRNKSVQDSLTLEGGVGFYKILNYTSINPPSEDTFSVVPLTAALRYNVFLSRSFGFFFYAGLEYNYVPADSPSGDTSATLTDAVGTLQSVFPAVGTGLLFRVGPNWYMRVDLGFDSLGVGLVLRF